MSEKVTRVRFLAFLKATRPRLPPFAQAGCGLNPLLETADAEKLTRSLVRHGKSTQPDMTLPLDCFNEVLSYLPVPRACEFWDAPPCPKMAPVPPCPKCESPDTMWVDTGKSSPAPRSARRSYGVQGVWVKCSECAQRTDLFKGWYRCTACPHNLCPVCYEARTQLVAPGAVGNIWRVVVSEMARCPADLTIAKVSMTCGLGLFLVMENPNMKAPEHRVRPDKLGFADDEFIPPNPPFQKVVVRLSAPGVEAALTELRAYYEGKPPLLKALFNRVVATVTGDSSAEQLSNPTGHRDADAAPAGSAQAMQQLLQEGIDALGREMMAAAGLLSDDE